MTSRQTPPPVRTPAALAYAKALAEAGPKRPPKYGNKSVRLDGEFFHSTGEARRWAALKLLLRAGEIRDLKRQTKHECIVNGVLVCTWTDDFSYVLVESGGHQIEDWKGVRTDEYVLKKKLFEACHPGVRILETGKPTNRKRKGKGSSAPQWRRLAKAFAGRAAR